MSENWAAAVCIVLFPIGLLALFARPTRHHGHCATGSGDKRVIEAVKIIAEGAWLGWSLSAFRPEPPPSDAPG